MARQSTKRKDKDRIVLRKGECQRPNGSYDYRWTDQFGKRHVIYGKTLAEWQELIFEAADEALNEEDAAHLHDLVSFARGRR